MNTANLNWDAPVPLGPTAPEPYPVPVLPQWVRDYVFAVADATQTPTDLPFLLALSALSVGVANKCRVTIRPGHREPSHIWTATVQPPGSRKSPVFSHMARPIFEYEEDLVRRTAPERKRAADEREVLEKALDQAKRDAASAAGDEGFGDARQRMHELRDKLDRLTVPGTPRLIASDVTSEKLAKLMAENGGRIAILAPEGDLFRIMAGRYSGGLNIDHYKRAWTGDEPIRDDRMGRDGTHVRRPALTMGLTLQPSVLETLEAKESFRGEGLLARFLYAVPESGIGKRLTGENVPPLDAGAARRYGDHLRRILDTGPRDVDEDGEFVPHELELSEGAREVLFGFEADVEVMLGPGCRLEHVRDWGGKLPGHATRAALILHVSARVAERVNPWSAPVSVEAMEAGVAIGRAAIPHALQVFDALEADPDVRLGRYVLGRVESLTARYGELPTKRDLFESVKGKRGLGTVEGLDSVLEVLQDHSLVKLIPQKSGGPGRPPSPLVASHPKAASDPRTIRRTPLGEGYWSRDGDSANSANAERGEGAEMDRRLEGFDSATGLR